MQLTNIEKAAIVAGYQYKGKVGEYHYVYDNILDTEKVWNPCLNAADCFDLMVKCNIQVKELPDGSVSGLRGYLCCWDSSAWKSQEKKWMSVIIQVACKKYEENNK